MAKMTPGELGAMLFAERADALSAMRASKLSAERTRAMDYYMGDMSADMPAQDGRSRAVSTDVADTVEGLMPSLMEIFAGSDEVVRFEPTGPQDVLAAEQETDYVNHVFMQQNPGFLVLYSFIKDALLSKVGIVKVWWEKNEEVERETYLDQPDDTFALLVSNPDVEVIEHSQRVIGAPADWKPEADGEMLPPGAMRLHDVTVETKRVKERARVEGVPPEEFGISRRARSLRDCGYCFHEVIRREEDLIADGYDPDEVHNLPSYTGLTNPEELARDTVDEHLSGGGDEGMNPTNRMVMVSEHYIHMDYERNGKPSLYRVTTGGEGGMLGKVLKRDGKLDIVEQDFIPFAAMTPVIMGHRFFGRSIADLVMDIQRIKTALLRSILDNAYLAVNPRVEVSEAHATETTLDDLLVSRPGGIVRTKQPGGLNWQTVPSIASEVFPVLEYADQTREWRTGVSHVSQGLDANALQNQSATAAMQVYNASQARMKLIARIFAETGIRDLFSLLHGVLRKNGSQPATVRLRQQWTTIDPRDWKQRDDMTINVGLGTGGKAERLTQLNAVINLQKDAVAAGLTNLVNPENLYASATAFCKLADFKNYSDFFTDPKTAPAPPQKPDPKMMEIQAQMQLDQQRAQQDAQVATQKAQTDAALAQQKFELDQRKMLMEHELETRRTIAEHELETRKANADHELKTREQNFQHAKEATGSSGDSVDGSQPFAQHLAGIMQQANAPLIEKLASTIQQAHAPLVQQLAHAIHHAAAPKRVVRDERGRVAGVEPVVQH